jgi:NAD(P)-dependent dehydrogenase (short-subunit alcohol dehydrogenase family)
MTNACTGTQGISVDLTGAVAAVTGGGGGIGAALCRALRQANASVAVLDLDAEAAATVAAEVQGIGIAVDVSDEAALGAAITQVESQLGPIDVFVSNAGVAFTDESADSAQTDNDYWRRSLEVNVMAHVYAARALLPGMLERGSGYLVNVASAAGLLSQIGAAAYSASKHAAVGFAESLAIAYSDQGIRVAVVCPQYVATDLVARMDQRLIEAVGGEVLSAEETADRILAGLRAEQFMILPHPEAATYFKRKAEDYDAWIEAMGALKRRALGDGTS